MHGGTYQGQPCQTYWPTTQTGCQVPSRGWIGQEKAQTSRFVIYLVRPFNLFINPGWGGDIKLSFPLDSAHFWWISVNLITD